MNINVFPILTNEVNMPFYVTSVGGWDNQDQMIRPNGFPDFQWIHCLNGRGELLTEDKKYLIGENMGILIYPKVSHQYYPVLEPWEVRWVSFSGFGVSDTLKSLGFHHSGAYTLKDLRLVDRYINDIYITTHSHSPFKGLERSALLFNMLVELKKNLLMVRADSHNLHIEQVRPVIQFMEENFATNPTLDEMAAIIDVTPQHLCRLFQKVFGVRPIEYYTLIKIQKAKEMLSANNLSIGEVAERTGFCNHSYFCAAFKKCEGITPREFKHLRTINRQDRRTTGELIPDRPGY